MQIKLRLLMEAIKTDGILVNLHFITALCLMSMQMSHHIV